MAFLIAVCNPASRLLAKGIPKPAISHCPFFIVRCLLSVFHCLFSIVRCPFSIVRFPLSVLLLCAAIPASAVLEDAETAMERAAARVESELRIEEADATREEGTVSPQVRQLLDGLAHPSPGTRKEAWRTAGPAGAAAVAPLVREYLSTETPNIHQACHAALEQVVFHAGRPGAESEAIAVADALLGLISTLTEESAVPPGFESRLQPGLLGLLDTMARDALRGRDRQARIRRIRGDAIYWAGLLASDSHVPALAALLREPDTADAAREALMRVPGANATQALLHAAEHALRAEDQARIIEALAERGAPDVIPRLKRLARAAPSQVVRWACIDTLARLAVPPTEVFPPSPDLSAEEKARYAHAGLCAAQALFDGGERERARQLFLLLTDISALRHQIRAALVGLAALHAEGLMSLALGYLTTPGVRETALHILYEEQGPGIDDRLVQAYEQTDPQMRAAILDVLARHKAPALQKLLDEALVSELPELRFAASRLLGIPCADNDLVHLATLGGPWIRPDALRSYLDLAHKRAISGDTEAAAAAFRTVLEGPFPVWSQREALEGLGNVGTESDVAVLRKYDHDPDLARNALLALVAMAPRLGDRDRARAALANIADNAPYEEAVVAAVNALEAMGENILPFARRHGYLIQWRLLGPFPNRAGDAFGKSFFPEAMGDAYEFVEYDGARFVWSDGAATGFPPMLDLHQILGAYEGVAAYGFARLGVSQCTPVQLIIETGGAYELWLNGRKLYERKSAAPSDEGADSIPTTLLPGANRILVKILQESGPWRYRVQVTDRHGAPLDLSKQRMPDDGTSGVGMRAGSVISAAENGLP